jgi:hypothetical protein
MVVYVYSMCKSLRNRIWKKKNPFIAAIVTLCRFTLDAVCLVAFFYFVNQFEIRENSFRMERQLDIFSSSCVCLANYTHTSSLFSSFFFRDKHETLGNTQMADKEGGQRRKIQTSRAAQLNETVGPVRPHP